MYSKYGRAKVQPAEFAIIIFRIKSCYSFGNTRRHTPSRGSFNKHEAEQKKTAATLAGEE